MSADIVSTPSGQKTGAQIALKQHDDAIKANAIKQGRALERAEQEKAIAALKAAHATELAVLTANHTGEIAGMRQAHEVELARTARRERAVGHHRAAWVYGIPSLIVGLLSGVGLTYWAADRAADTLARNFREQAMTGAIIQATQPPQRCVPGEMLQNGTICPR